jgi:hypothetical protein
LAEIDAARGKNEDAHAKFKRAERLLFYLLPSEIVTAGAERGAALAELALRKYLAGLDFRPLVQKNFRESLSIISRILGAMVDQGLERSAAELAAQYLHSSNSFKVAYANDTIQRVADLCRLADAGQLIDDGSSSDDSYQNYERAWTFHGLGRIGDAQLILSRTASRDSDFFENAAGAEKFRAGIKLSESAFHLSLMNKQDEAKTHFGRLVDYLSETRSAASINLNNRFVLEGEILEKLGPTSHTELFDKTVIEARKDRSLGSWDKVSSELSGLMMNASRCLIYSDDWHDRLFGKDGLNAYVRKTLGILPNGKMTGALLCAEILDQAHRGLLVEAFSMLASISKADIRQEAACNLSRWCLRRDHFDMAVKIAKTLGHKRLKQLIQTVWQGNSLSIERRLEYLRALTICAAKHADAAMAHACGTMILDRTCDVQSVVKRFTNKSARKSDQLPPDSE